MMGVGVATGCTPSRPAAPSQQDPSLVPHAAETGTTQVATATNEVVASVHGDDITARDLLGPLIEANGLDVMLELAERALARQMAAREGVTVSSDDVANETKLTIDRFRKAVHQNDLLAATMPTEGPEAD